MPWALRVGKHLSASFAPLPKSLTILGAGAFSHSAMAGFFVESQSDTPDKAHPRPRSGHLTQGFPEKAHLRNVIFPETSHDRIQTAREDLEFDRFYGPRKASPLIIVTKSGDHRDIGFSVEAPPENLHLRRTGHRTRSLNPLTLFPDAAHASPRTPSRIDPANAHLTSRKASPDRTQSLIQ